MTCDLVYIYQHTSNGWCLNPKELINGTCQLPFHLAPLCRGSAARRAKVSIFTAFSSNGAVSKRLGRKIRAIFWGINFLGPWWDPKMCQSWGQGAFFPNVVKETKRNYIHNS